MQNATYKTVKLLRTLSTNDLAAVAIEYAAKNPSAFLKTLEATGISATTGNDSLVAKVLAIRGRATYVTCASNKVALIKAYRELTGAGLREAKDWVEENMKAHL